MKTTIFLPYFIQPKYSIWAVYQWTDRQKSAVREIATFIFRQEAYDEAYRLNGEFWKEEKKK
jgi:hypothetical protein